jgi:hypothetical protein
MKHLYLIFVLAIFLLIGTISISFAQRIGIGGRHLGVGGASVTLQDGWAVFNNIGALAWLNQPTVMTAYENRFAVAGLNTVAAGFAMPTLKSSAWGTTITHFGDNLYNEVNLGVGASHKINTVSLGIKANYLQISMEGLGTRSVFAFEFGGLMQFTPTLFAAAHIYNFNQAQIANFQQEKLPTIMKAGLSYRPLKNLQVNGEVVKNIDFPATLRAGVEYKPIEKLAVRTGINTAPFTASFGVGLQLFALQVDYALQTHSVLLPAHQLSLVYLLKKKKKSGE